MNTLEFRLKDFMELQQGFSDSTVLVQKAQ